MKKNVLFTLSFGIVLMILSLPSCRKDENVEPFVPSEPDVPSTTSVPDNTALFPSTASEYAVMIASELGVVPTVILDEMEQIPLYQNGSRVYGVFNNASELDNPTMFGKGTVSGSAIQRYEGVSVTGESLPHVVWIAFLRNSSQSTSHIFGSLQMIGYNELTGATAFLESSDDIGSYASSMDPVTFEISGVMPGPDNSSAFNSAFIPPPAACVSCHQADPFITNSFITSAKIPGTNTPIIPILDANAPYYVIGGGNWDMRTIHIEGNACVSCHRVGLATVRLFAETGFDVNSYMPVHSPGSQANDALELMNAWNNGVENTPNAEWVIPAVGSPGPNQIVGSGYLYQDDFNNP